MKRITLIHKRELDSVRELFSAYFEEHRNEIELDRLYHRWIPLLSTYVTHDSIETTIDDWYALIAHSHIWLHYIEETQAKSTRPIVIQTLEAWKKPFIFAGSRTEKGTYKSWSDGNDWMVTGMAEKSFIGIALPLPESKHTLIQHFFKAPDNFLFLLEEDFESSPYESKQLYLQRSYLSCLAHLSDE